MEGGGGWGTGEEAMTNAGDNSLTLDQWQGGLFPNALGRVVGRWGGEGACEDSLVLARVTEKNGTWVTKLGKNPSVLI